MRPAAAVVVNRKDHVASSASATINTHRGIIHVAWSRLSALATTERGTRGTGVSLSKHERSANGSDPGTSSDSDSRDRGHGHDHVTRVQAHSSARHRRPFMVLNVTVPPGSRAEIHVPTNPNSDVGSVDATDATEAAATQITESGRMLWRSNGNAVGAATHGTAGKRVQLSDGRNAPAPLFHRIDGDFAVFQTGCGQYSFNIAEF